MAHAIQIQPMLRLNPFFNIGSPFLFLYSNTTNVKVKFEAEEGYTVDTTEFKYNQC